MIPILFEANETAFSSQGLGALADAVSCSVSRVVNGKDELTMVYPSEGIRYADLVNDRIIYAQPEYRKTAQPYQIYKITRPLNGKVTVYARHVGAQRAGFIPVTAFTAGTLTETLNSLPNHLAESSPFTFWTNKTVTANFKLTKPASLGKVLGGMEGSILDVYGGEYEYDGYTIKLWNRRGVDSGVELRYAKNITDIEQSEDVSPIVTGVVPYWEGVDGTVVSLPEVVIEGQYADTYAFRRTIVKDFSDRFDEQPTVAELRTVATTYVNQGKLGLPDLNLKVSFEHLAQYTGYENLQLLEALNLGDTVSIYYEPLDVRATARISKTTYDCLREKYSSVQIGSVRSGLEQVMSQVTNAQAQMRETLSQGIPSALESAVENATDLITGANGGYVVIDRDANGKPYQILIMDTDDKATATNVIRLNQNGIGFSTSGYSGPFSTAWTIDSNFVADFITTGTLNAALAKIGVLADAAGKNSWNMATGVLSISNGKIVATFTRTFRHQDYSNSDVATIQSLITAGSWTDAQLEKYDINLDGTLTISDLVKVRNMVQNGTDETATIKTEIDPSKPSRPICIYNGSAAKAYLSPNAVGAPSGSFSRLSVGESTWWSGATIDLVYSSTSKARVSSGGLSFGDLQNSGERCDLSSNGISWYDSSGTLKGEFPSSLNLSNMDDYVIDEGESGLWYYRRWNSGLYECWARVEFGAIAVNGAWGNVFYHSVPRYNYPVTFKESPIEVVNVTGGDYAAWISGSGYRPTTTQTAQYYLFRPASTSSGSYVIDFYVRGQLP